MYVEEEASLHSKLSRSHFCVQDRITLLPRIAKEVSYFWTSPSLNLELFQASRIENKGATVCYDLARNFVHYDP